MPTVHARIRLVILDIEFEASGRRVQIGDADAEPIGTGRQRVFHEISRVVAAMLPNRPATVRLATASALPESRA